MKKDLLIIALAFIIILPIIDAAVIPAPPVKSNIKLPKRDIKRLYSLALDSFFIDKGKIEPNQYLGTIFNKYDIPYETVQTLLKNTEKIFDIKTLRLGQSYAVFRSKSNTKKVEYFAYEQNVSEYIVFDFNKLNAVKYSKQVESKEVKLSGVIKTSLWNTMIENGINPNLSIDLSEVYAWTINFFGLQKGDKFRVVVDENYVENQFVGYGKIKTAWFENMGRQVYAIPFFQDSTEAYYDQEGGSLRRAFLKAPLKFSSVASGFQRHRLDPVYRNVYMDHLAVDYNACTGTPILAIGDGIIVRMGFNSMSGNEIWVQHNSVYRTACLHLSKFGEGMKVGRFVKQGEVIGYVGSTGHSTGPHLHFVVWKNEVPIDPLTMEAPPAVPIKEKYKKDFNARKDSMINILDKIKIKDLFIDELVASKLNWKF